MPAALSSGLWPAIGSFGASADERMSSLNKPTVQNASKPAAITESAFDSATYAAFRAVFDSSSEALVIISQSGAIQTANPRAKELLELRERGAEAIGLDDLLTGSTSEQLRALSRRGQTFVASARAADASITASAPIRVTLRAVLPVSQHLLLSLEESSDSPAGGPNQRHLEAEFRAILDSLQPGVLILDLRGQIRWSNPRFAELLGLHGPELENIKTLDELSSLMRGRFQNPQVFSARWRSFLAGHRGPAHDDLELLQPASRLLERFSRTVSDHGHTVGWLEIYSDVTEKRQIQSQKLQTEKMAALGKVVAGIAHELNNPLTTIMGNIQLLLGRGLHPAAVSEARRIYQESERARRIVKNLLYFARENKPDRSAVDLNEIVERTLAVRSYELKIKNIRIQTELTPDLPKTMADPYQLQQVVLNLLMNAEQAVFEGRGQGVVKIRTWCSRQEKVTHLFLELSDDGPGIAPAIASKIFDPFFTTKPPGMGTGLGLSIVYGIVRQHDGEVSFESDSSSGTRFTVQVPVVNPQTEITKKKAVNLSGHTTTVKPSHILVVEDEPTVAQLIVDVLQEEGHFANAVFDSREGLELLSRRSYDLVICDLRMPRGDGRSFFRALERSKNPIRQPILFITGDTLSPSTLEFMEGNRLPYLAKPFLVEELKLAVRQQLQANHGMIKGAKRKKPHKKRMPRADISKK
jgi:two-component system NtrC family sensor kinase